MTTLKRRDLHTPPAEGVVALHCFEPSERHPNLCAHCNRVMPPGKAGQCLSYVLH